MEIDDDRSQDITTLVIPTQDLGNLATVDASQMQGTLHIYAGGATLKLLKVAENMTVIVAGTDPANPAEVTVADTKLSDIRSNVSVEGAELTIDNSTNAAASIFTMTTNSYTGWSIPNSTFEPTIFLGNDLSPLVGNLTLHTAAGDQIDIEGTPPKVETLVIDNKTTIRNAIFVVAATCNMLITGDFDLYLGRRINPNGTTERTKRLSPISNVQIVFNFSSVDNDGTNTIFDGDLDPAGAQYSISGGSAGDSSLPVQVDYVHMQINPITPFLEADNQTLGISVTIFGYRDQDEAYVYLPGGSVDANLQYTSPGKIYIDGQARLNGTNPTAPNAISVAGRYGQVNLTPLSTDNSLLDVGQDVYLLGSMPQDGLAVSIPTNVVMTPTITNTFQLHLNQGQFVNYWEAPTDPNYLISWASGGRPEFFPFMNTSEDQWDSVYTPSQGNAYAPNPFDEIPYGVTLPGQFAGYVVTDWTWQEINNVETLVPVYYHGIVREWAVNDHPTAVNNNVTLDASQLRGSFQFNVAAPDYDYLGQLENETFSGNVATETTEFDAPFWTWGTTVADFMPMAFGQSNIVVSKVNPQLSLTINSGDQIPSYFFAKDPENDVLPDVDAINMAVTPFPFTTVTVGTGTLADIQGNVAVHNVWLKDVDDRLGTLAGNLILTGTTLTGWATDSGSQGTLSFDTLQGDLTLSGSMFDQFGIEDTPNTAYQTTIENFGTTGPTTNVYVMGKTVMPLSINGHFSVYVGRRLNADGSLTAVGKVDNVFNANDTYAVTGTVIANTIGYTTNYFGTDYFIHNAQLISTGGSGPLATLPGTFNGPSNILPGVSVGNYLNENGPATNQMPLPLFYNYAGDGQGTLVFDASNDAYVPSQGDYSGPEEGILANPNYPTEADLRYRTVGDIIWGSNIETFDYAPAYNRPANASFLRSGPTEIINNPVNGEIHYFVNTNTVNSWVEVEVGATLGALEVVGDDQYTRVDLDPLYSKSIATLYDISVPNLLPGWGAATGGSDNLLSTILGDVTVRHAGLTIHGDTAGSTAPATLPQIVLTDTQITGIAGGTIHFSNLTQSYSLATENAGTFANQFPGLVVRMQTYGGQSVQVQNTPGGTNTELFTETNGINDLTVLGTTGPLWLANLAGMPYGGSGEFSRFLTKSVTIGNGNLSAIAGAVTLGSASSLGQVTIDDRSDTTSRQVTTKQVPSTSLFALAGLSPAPIDIDESLTLSELDIYGVAASQYSFQWAPQGTRLFAGAGSNVELTKATNFSYIAPVSVYGAASVLIDPPINPSFQSADAITIGPDPTRPTETTNLTIDFTKALVSGIKLGSVGNGVYALFGSSGNVQAITYQGATTHLSLLLYTQPVDPDLAYLFTLPVTDTAPSGTTISAGIYAVNVQGTTGPLTLEQGATGVVTLGNNGSLAGIQGAVSILANNAALPSVPITFDDSADSASKTVTMSQDMSGNLQLSGLLSNPVAITGNLVNLTLKGGTGSNNLVAPDVTDSWVISGANSGALNRTIAFSGFGSLQSGNQNDNIFFKTNGSLTGNLDGGPGTDTLYYQAGMLTGSDVINLPAHIAPRVTGQALNIESSNTFNALTVTNPGNKNIQVDAPVNFAIPATGGFGTKVFIATGLPAGVTIDPATGIISGTNTTEFYSANVVVTVTDDTGSVSVNFGWSTLSGLILTSPGVQTSQVTQTINLPIQTAYTYGGTLTYTATGLPAGLSINSATGVISGTINDGDQTGSPYTVNVQATDGTHSASIFIGWTVLKSFFLANPGTQLFPEDLPVSLQIQAFNPAGPVTYSATGLPSNLQIDPHTGLISGTLADYSNSNGHFVNFPVQVTVNDTHQNLTTSFNFGTEPGFQDRGVFDRTNRAGDSVSTFISAFDPDQKSTVIITSITGLPPGLTFDPASGIISGTIDQHAFTGSPYETTVTYQNQTYNYTVSESFNWTVTPVIIIGNPGDQNSVVGAIIDLPIQGLQAFGQPVTFSARNLPVGLTIDPNTGEIHGTMGPQVSSPADVSVEIDATDGTADGNVVFKWHVTSPTANVVELFDSVTGGTLTLTSPVGTTLTAQANNDDFFFPGNLWNFPLGDITFSVTGVTPGGSADVTLHSSTAINASDYLVDYGITPAENDDHSYDFLYQHPTDTDDASTTGAEFLSNGDILLHLVDGGRGDDDLTADGQINVAASGPAALNLTAQITGAPTSWPVGVPLTLGSEIGGSAVSGATLQWQVYLQTDFAYIPEAQGTDPTLTFTPGQAGSYLVNLTVTSADGSVSLSPSLIIDGTATAAGTPPIGSFAIAGLPSDILAGHSISGTIFAEDASGKPLESYTGPISIQITDPQNNTIYSTSGNFDPSQFTLGPVTLNNSGSSSITDTITITAGAATVSLPVAVHPVSRFVATQDSLSVDAETAFNLSFVAEDDRGVFDSNYSGPAKLTYADNQGEHDLSGGFQTVTGGVVTFQNVVLPSGGVYQLQATSADGKVVGSFFVDSQGTVVDTTPPSSSVSLLPNYETSGSFTVSWSGSDDANGSGIASYDIYVSDNGGAYTQFLSQTTGTSATFNGQDRHHYSFYSVATDDAGNTEQAPTSADATTLVDTSAPTSSINTLSADQQSPSIALSWTGGDGTNGSGIAGFDIYVSSNGGAYTLWKHENATTTSDTYTGFNGGSFKFYSIATDRAGNVETAPAAADATTLIDSIAPSSSVNKLPGYITTTSFQVSWSGSDGANGSGIAYYDIYVSDNNGAYSVFQSHTTQTSATFNGQDGHLYIFYSVATDNAGNVEPAPNPADTAGFVDATPPTSSITALAATQQSTSIQLAWTGSDGPNGSNIAGFDIYVSDNNGAYSLWKHEASAKSSDTYVGVVSHSYSFYSIATDNAGNVEQAPAVPDATTLIAAPTTPNSSIDPLATYQQSTSIQLTWSGNDGGSGSGVASFDIYVSDNGGAYALWKHESATTLSDAYSGADGHRYSFYSIASDNSGNVEQAPATPDATTLIDATAPTSNIHSLSTYLQSTNVQLSWTSSDGANGSGIAGFDIYVSDNSGAYTLWKHESAAAMTDTYSGTNGHTYGFYSIATDNAGNVEQAPATADATTTIDTTAPTSNINVLSAYQQSASVQLSWTGSDGRMARASQASTSMYQTTAAATHCGRTRARQQ